MPKIQTVLGPIDPKKLSVTLAHEHLQIDVRSLWTLPAESMLRKYANQPVQMSNLGVLRRNPAVSKDNLILNDVDLAVKEALVFKKSGGRSIVDQTSVGIGRNAESLRVISKRTGLNIIAGSGYYVGNTHPKTLKKRGSEEIAKEIIHDINHGIDNTSVKSGIIGEIGIGPKMSSREEKILRAAGIAHKETACPISVHLTPPARQGHKVLDVLFQEGVKFERVALDHLDSQLDLEYDVSLIERGCYICYDEFGEQYDDLDGISFPRDIDRIEYLVKLRDKG